MPVFRDLFTALAALEGLGLNPTCRVSDLGFSEGDLNLLIFVLALLCDMRFDAQKNLEFSVFYFSVSDELKSF